MAALARKIGRNAPHAPSTPAVIKATILPVNSNRNESMKAALKKTKQQQMIKNNLAAFTQLNPDEQLKVKKTFELIRKAGPLVSENIYAPPPPLVMAKYSSEKTKPSSYQSLTLSPPLAANSSVGNPNKSPIVVEEAYENTTGIFHQAQEGPYNTLQKDNSQVVKVPVFTKDPNFLNKNQYDLLSKKDRIHQIPPSSDEGNYPFVEPLDPSNEQLNPTSQYAQAIPSNYPGGWVKYISNKNEISALKKQFVPIRRLVNAEDSNIYNQFSEFKPVILNQPSKISTENPNITIVSTPFYNTVDIPPNYKRPLPPTPQTNIFNPVANPLITGIYTEPNAQIDPYYATISDPFDTHTYANAPKIDEIIYDVVNRNQNKNIFKIKKSTATNVPQRTLFQRFKNQTWKRGSASTRAYQILQNQYNKHKIAGYSTNNINHISKYLKTKSKNKTKKEKKAIYNNEEKKIRTFYNATLKQTQNATKLSNAELDAQAKWHELAGNTQNAVFKKYRELETTEDAQPSVASGLAALRKQAKEASYQGLENALERNLSSGESGEIVYVPNISSSPSAPSYMPVDEPVNAATVVKRNPNSGNVISTGYETENEYFTNVTSFEKQRKNNSKLQIRLSKSERNKRSAQKVLNAQAAQAALTEQAAKNAKNALSMQTRKQQFNARVEQNKIAQRELEEQARKELAEFREKKKKNNEALLQEATILAEQKQKNPNTSKQLYQPIINKLLTLKSTQDAENREFKKINENYENNPTTLEQKEFIAKRNRTSELLNILNPSRLIIRPVTLSSKALEQPASQVKIVQTASQKQPIATVGSTLPTVQVKPIAPATAPIAKNAVFPDNVSKLSDSKKKELLNLQKKKVRDLTAQFEELSKKTKFSEEDLRTFNEELLDEIAKFNKISNTIITDMANNRKMFIEN